MKKLNYLLIFIIPILFISCSSDDSGTTPTDNTNVLSADNFITFFELSKGTFLMNYPISNNAINGFVPEDLELNDIQLNVTISNKATINPDPATISTISGPFNLSVTAENGDVREYTIDIKRELNAENFILSYTISTNDFITTTDVDSNTTTIIKRLPSFSDKANLDLDIVYSEQATISPNPDTIVNYSSDVEYTVTAANGDQRNYIIKVETMDMDFNNVCDDMTASRWFGGDDRTNAPSGIMPFDRNVGTGQGVVFEEDVHPTKFGFNLTGTFKSSENDSNYNNPLDIKLNIRQQDGTLIDTMTQTIPADFNGGWVEFDITNFKIFFDANTEYIFTMHLVNGENLGVNTGIHGINYEGNGFCFKQAYAGESKISENTDIDNWSSWYESPWHFNIKMEGKK